MKITATQAMLWRPDNRKHHDDVRVFLDGIEQVRVVEADTDEGTITCLRLNAEGHEFVDPENPGQAAYEVLHGRVTVQLPTWWPPASGPMRVQALWAAVDRLLQGRII